MGGEEQKKKNKYILRKKTSMGVRERRKEGRLLLDSIARAVKGIRLVRGKEKGDCERRAKEIDTIGGRRKGEKKG